MYHLLVSVRLLFPTVRNRQVEICKQQMGCSQEMHGCCDGNKESEEDGHSWSRSDSSSIRFSVAQITLTITRPQGFRLALILKCFCAASNGTLLWSASQERSRPISKNRTALCIAVFASFLDASRQRDFCVSNGLALFISIHYVQAPAFQAGTKIDGGSECDAKQDDLHFVPDLG